MIQFFVCLFWGDWGNIYVAMQGFNLDLFCMSVQVWHSFLGGPNVLSNVTPLFIVVKKKEKKKTTLPKSMENHFKQHIY